MLRRVDSYIVCDVSEEPTAFIFRRKKSLVSTIQRRLFLRFLKSFLYALVIAFNCEICAGNYNVLWAGHVARMGEERGCIGSWWGNRRGRDHWGDLGVDGWIILGWFSRRWDVGIWTGLGWPRIETVGGRL